MKHLRKFDITQDPKDTCVEPTINQASAERIRAGIYCPQNRWGKLNLGIDSKVGFAHVKEGVDEQLEGLKTMLTKIVNHKGKEKVNAFACGSTTTNSNATAFRKKIKSAVEGAGIEHFDCSYGDTTTCGAWLCQLKQADKAEIVVGTAGITSCIGVIAWSPNVVTYSIEYIAFTDLTLFENVTLQESLGEDNLLEKVDLDVDKYKVT